jgi:dipeptidyl aminopeptidase/acylaminoacyl peptidase
VTVDGMDPSENTAKVSMPILIYHGEYDVRVPMFHSVDFYNAVKDRTKARLVRLDKMGHQGDKWTADNIRDHYKAIDEFLANDCGVP